MKVKASSISEYLENIPAERKAIMNELISTISKNLPNGFKEKLGYGMPAWIVPHSLYPDGYHCTPELPLPFMNLASQKNFIALYHMGIYANHELMQWFVSEYPKHCSKKLDMGKSCIRFKKIEEIPFALIAELCTKMTPQDWIDLYEKNYKR
ncbi:MAG TPA: DUF1801 domain-containing protein [Flavobacteriales bacterium]|nr:DUF1801 domain-containing protein [Flavobacteriales bacterium]